MHYYQWRGEDVTEEEVLKRSNSKMVNAIHIERFFNPFTGEIDITKTRVRMPSYALENMRGTANSYYIVDNYEKA